MPAFILRTTMAVLAATGLALGQNTDLTQPVSLSDFTPRVNNLPASCQRVYTSKIASCVAGDFLDQNNGKTCSSGCLNGLVQIGKDVQANCKTADASETSIIGEFLSGNAIQLLCPGVVVTTIASSTASTQAQQSSATPIKISSSSAAQQSSSSKGSSATLSSLNAASSTQGATLTLETSVAAPPQTVAPPAATAQPQSTLKESTSKPSSTPKAQKSNQDSGGGSPFDVVATGSSPRMSYLGNITINVMLCAVTFLFALL